RDGSGLVLFAVLAFLCHALAPNKYAGYAAFVVVYLIDLYLWPAVNVASHLVAFAGRPAVVESAFFGDAPYRLAWGWVTRHWLLGAPLRALVTVLFWPRGRRERWPARAREAALRLTPRLRAVATAGLLAFLACGGWIAYNTEVVNHA